MFSWDEHIIEIHEDMVKTICKDFPLLATVKYGLVSRHAMRVLTLKIYSHMISSYATSRGYSLNAN